MKQQMVYERPEVLNHQPIRFETAQCWNKGHGNEDHPGKGNGGIQYPLPPYDGAHQGENANGGVGTEKK